MRQHAESDYVTYQGRRMLRVRGGSPIANPLTNSRTGWGVGAQTPTADVGSADQQTRQRHSAGGGAMYSPIGTGSLGAEHNTPLHVAALILFGLGLIYGLNALGFGFSFAVGAGK